jgi:hypothetical protein
MINQVLQPLVYIWEMIGEAVGELLSPFIMMAEIVSVLAYDALTPLIAVIQIVANVFTMFSDFIIDNIINPIIRAINGFTTGLNNMFGWAGVHIAQLAEVQNSSARKKDAR